MSTPSNRRGDLTDPPSLAGLIQDSTPVNEKLPELQIEESVQVVSEDASSNVVDEDRFRPRPSYELSESLPVIGSHSSRFNWWGPTLALAFAAGLLYVVVDDPPLPWDQAGSLSLARKTGERANHEVANLIVNKASPRPMDQPAPLGVSIDNPTVLDFLVVSGLPKGAALSAGHSVGDDGWLLYATEIKDAVIRPPPHFVGVMELTVSLVDGPGVNTSEGRPLRFEWVAEKAPEIKLPEQTAPATKAQDVTAPAATVRNETPPVAKVQAETPPAAKSQDETPPMAKVPDETPPVAKAQEEAPPAAKSRSQTTRPLSAEETAALLKRGNDLVSSGDIAAARLVLLRAAEAGNASAAFALAGTYNPITLEKLQVHGLSPDLAIARQWYEKARELGSPDASRELQILAAKRN